MNAVGAILMVFAVALAGASQQSGAQQVSRTGSFDLPCSTDVAFPLFSPEGERNWVKGWNPRPLFPESVVFGRDTVFAEGEADHEAVWTIVDVDWRIHKAEYVRLAPASHTAHITVSIEARGPRQSHVSVSYTVTALGGDAAAVLKQFSEEAYAAKMHDWEQQISAYLGTMR